MFCIWTGEIFPHFVR